VDDQRFQRLFTAARNSVHEQRSARADTIGMSGDFQLDVAKRESAFQRAIKAQRQYRQTIDLLEAECTPEQWNSVLEAIEQGWPEP